MSLEDDLKAQDARPHQPADGELGGRDPAAHRPTTRAASCAPWTSCRRPSPATTRRSTRPRSRRAMAEVVASQPPAAAGRPGLRPAEGVAGRDREGRQPLRGADLPRERGLAVRRPRAAMFIVKGPSAIGWYARGIEPADAVKQVNVPLTADTVFRTVHNSRQPLRGLARRVARARAQALARLGGSPQGIAGGAARPARQAGGHPLLRHARRTQVPAPTRTSIEMLVLFAGKTSTCCRWRRKPAVGRTTRRARRTRARGGHPRRAATRCASARACRLRAAASPPAAPPTPAGLARRARRGLVHRDVQRQPRSPRCAPGAPRPRPPPAAAGPRPRRRPPAAPLSPEEQKAHEDAKRFARLVVSEIKLYNEAKVNEGRRTRTSTSG